MFPKIDLKFLKKEETAVTQPIFEKQALRKTLMAKRSEISSIYGIEYSAAICSNLEILATYRYAEGYLMYFPLKNEVDVVCAIKKLLGKGKRVYLPRCRKDAEGIMDFYEIATFEDLEEGSFKVMEPKESCKRVSYFSKNTVCIVPGIAFDREGYRLGYGKGYYDRFLKNYSGTKIGVVFSDLVCDDLPRGRYDNSVDFIITEKGVTKIND